MTTSSAKSKGFFTVSSLVVSKGKVEFRYLANRCAGVFIADKIGQNLRVMLMPALFTLGLSYKILCKVPTRQMLSNYFSLDLSLFLSYLKQSFSLILRLI